MPRDTRRKHEKRERNEEDKGTRILRSTPSPLPGGWILSVHDSTGRGGPRQFPNRGRVFFLGVARSVACPISPERPTYRTRLRLPEVPGCLARHRIVFYACSRHRSGGVAVGRNGAPFHGIGCGGRSAAATADWPRRQPRTPRTRVFVSARPGSSAVGLGSIRRTVDRDGSVVP